MAVIKANAYGHGLVEIGQYLDSQGIDALMVNKLYEAIKLREAGITCPLTNYGPFSANDATEIINYEIIQTVYNDNVEFLEEKAKKLGKKVQLNIHIYTRFGSIRITYYKAFSYIENIFQMKNLHVYGISTSLTEEIDFDSEQIKRFQDLYNQAEQKGIHLGIRHMASSDSLFTLPSTFMDMVRPGTVLYGYYPNKKTQEKDPLSLKPVLQLKSCVVDIKNLRPGDSLYYHREYVAKEHITVAVIAIGWIDGYPKNIVGKGCIIIKGKRLPIIGGILSHYIFAALPNNFKVQLGDEVTIIGTQGDESLYADEIAGWEGNLAYNVTSVLNPIFPRKIIL